MKWTYKDYIGSVILGTLLLVPFFICVIPFKLFLDDIIGCIILLIIEIIWIILLLDRLYLSLCKSLKLEERIKMEIEMKKLKKLIKVK